jgi:hypothetical protein
MSYITDLEKKYARFGIDRNLMKILHTQLCEIVPSVPDDSELPEWTTKELARFILTTLALLKDFGLLNTLQPKQ